MSPLSDPHTWKCISKLQHLRILGLDPACVITDSKVLQDLELLTGLTKLHLALRLRSYVPQSMRGFLDLSHLNLDLARDVDADLLQVFASPGIRTLAVTFWAPAMLDLVKVTNWASASLKQLRTLYIESYSGPEVTAAMFQYVGFEAVISPILNCGALENLCLHLPIAWSVTGAGDAELDMLARNLPRLRCLSLLIRFSNAVTPESLVSFASHCPNLAYLRLRLVNFASLTAASPTLDTVLPRHRALLCLEICSPQGVEDPKACAVFLQRLFPRLAVRTPKRMCPVCFPFGIDCKGGMDAIYQAFEGASAPSQNTPTRVLRDRR
ncbi:hypothetical protein ACG7TL_008625 [Trametes sanguinea]